MEEELMKLKPFLSLTILLLTSLWLAGCVFFKNAKPDQASPTQSKPTQTAMPTPKKAVTTAETGAVKLQLIDIKTGKPIAGQLILLAELLQVQGQLQGAYIPAMDPVSSPKDNSDDEGWVIINGAKPKKYAVTLLTPQGPILLQDMDTNKDLLVEVKAGEVTDLGTKKVAVPDYLMTGN
jgi:hypothetical protein